jgi:CRP/FNR family transcriptional regulator, anaerobic regulatory protein
MTRQPTTLFASAGPGRGISPCATCQLRFFNICGLLLRHGSPLDGASKWQVHKTIAARRNIKSQGEHTDWVYVICDGWAFRFAQLPDGRRQVLSILIPGDVVTTIRPFDDDVRFSVQALTDVHYCGFDRLALREKLAENPDLLNAWSHLIIVEQRENFNLAIDLGCRSAHERIARLLVHLQSRLEERGLRALAEAGIPLPQWFIADAVGLTSDHVSRVIVDFRKSDLVETRKALLKVIDLEGLRRLSGVSPWNDAQRF